MIMIEGMGKKTLGIHNHIVNISYRDHGNSGTVIVNNCECETYIVH